MHRKEGLSSHREASLLDRRTYLKVVSGVAAGAAVSAVGESATASTNEPHVDVASVTADHTWTTVQLSDSHADPVVIAPALSYQGRQPATTRVRNVANGGFDLSVEEWLYLDGWHLEESVGYLATDPGSYGLADGTTVEVGRFDTNHRWASNSLSASFSKTPVVFSQAQTENGRQPIVTRNRGVSRSNVDVRLQEEEARGAHRRETVGYLAVEPGVGTMADHAFEAGVQPDVGGRWQTIEFESSYRQPAFLADLQTTNGANTCAVRYRNLTESTVEVKVEEEQSEDAETAHVGEALGYLVVERETGDTPLADLDRNRVERLVHSYVNERREAHGFDALAFDTDLREIARYHSKDMAQNDYFAHTSPGGETMSDRYETFEYDCRADAGDGSYYTGAENIAYTYYDTDVRTENGTVRYTTADELASGLVRGWMNSKGHRENILMDAWDDEGIGVYVTSSGKVYATQNFC